MIELQTQPEISGDLAPDRSEAQTVAERPLSTPSLRIARSMLRFALSLVACLLILAVFVPFDPIMPGSWPDMSWMMAMNQAVAQHLAFGRDIVFTFGPFASIYSEVYHPATDQRMILGSLFLGLSCFTLVYLLARDRVAYAMPLYGLLLAALVNSRDALLLSYPLLLALAVHAIALPDDDPMALRLGKKGESAFAILFAPLSLLVLIKVSLFPGCIATAVFCGIFLWHRGKRFLAWAGPATAMIAGVLLWAAAGQPILALPGFAAGAVAMFAGYSEAMAVQGDLWECILYILTGTILLAVIWTERKPRSSKLLLSASYVLFLFMAFKGAFVRHNPWHNIIASSAIAIAAFLLLFVAERKRALLPIALAVFTCAYIGDGSIQVAATHASLNLRVTVERVFHGMRERFAAGALERDYDRHLAAIHAQFPVDSLPGTTDIYSLNQAWLLASANTWAPRPVVQSYSAYMPELAELNLQYLKSARAPDNIVFRIEPIDGRLPSLEDGLSWPAMIDGYAVVKLRAQTAYLRKRTTEDRPVMPDAVEVYRGSHKFGEEVALPERRGPLFAKIQVHPTLLGRILGAVFKPPQLHISMRLGDGSEMKYRTVSTMMNSEFLITPLVNRTEEFALLAAGGFKYLAGNEVKSFAISSDDSSGKYWNPVYSVSLQRLDLAGNSDAENAVLFDKRDDTASAVLSYSSKVQCEGSIDLLNGKVPASADRVVHGALYVSGWMAIAPDEGAVPDSTFVWLKNDHGKAIFVRARNERRDDVKQHLNQPEMPNPGYAAMIDVSDLRGRYTLGLARTYKGSLGVCRQFQFPLVINPQP
jgi:hypothetical protein